MTTKLNDDELIEYLSEQDVNPGLTTLYGSTTYDTINEDFNLSKMAILESHNKSLWYADTFPELFISSNIKSTLPDDIDIMAVFYDSITGSKVIDASTIFGENEYNIILNAINESNQPIYILHNTGLSEISSDILKTKYNNIFKNSKFLKLRSLFENSSTVTSSRVNNLNNNSAVNNLKINLLKAPYNNQAPTNPLPVLNEPNTVNEPTNEVNSLRGGRLNSKIKKTKKLYGALRE